MDMTIDNHEAERFENEYEARLEAEADAALDRIERGQTWLDWRKVAELFAHGRKLAMLNGHANKPEGKGYNTCFSAWIKEHPRLAKLDGVTRKHCLDCWDQIDAIETWRATLAETGSKSRQTINHPTVMLRRFLADQRAGETGEKPEKKPSLREALQEANAGLEAENAKLKRKIEESGENLFALNDSAKSIARLLRDYWSANKLAELSKALVEEAKIKRGLEGKNKNGGPRT